MSNQPWLVTTTTSSYSLRWNDKGSGATRDGGFWHPKSEGDFRPLGSVGLPHWKDINGSHSSLLIKANPNATGALPPVTSPTGYTLIWKDEKSKADKDGSFWRPIAPNGYVALGDVARGGWSTPDISDVWCVRADLVKQGSFAAHSVWDDKKSGAKTDVSIWEIRSASRSDESGIDDSAAAEPIPADPRATYLGAIRASQNYNAPDSSFARVPAV
ncbi:uncharacterized protein TrAFT101_005581 [Trichoderma asperellum]|uniref:uncharacterized protein n=1 Tax=Trichoderma asperellum TaxID=101201 RepID=UPI003317A4E0|nr:hypothetical protein TrAFT101_005581 [Trichoderma asperellum]